MSKPYQIRGSHIVPLRDFLVARYDEPTRERILVRLSDDTRSALEDPRPDAWYPAQVASEVNRAIFAINDSPERAYEEVKSDGEAIAEYGVNTFMRLLIKLMTPEMLAKKWPTIWARGHNFGRLETDLSHVPERKLSMTISDVSIYSHLGPTAVGFLSFTLHAMGRREAKVVERELDYARRDASSYTYDVTW